ncbi:MAG: SUF system NifU family Fe-S cluster assembly protein [Candidatus Marsarchaeota archaeon]|jgi:nitrogen fixation NifU-like protein|nr:SUF system NifU family Fe-S cluster assembly protein [Candidatus Marsarchaeota archaeon]MCL5418613.1 SUF system NifU family Fe-S cluster assembly protein [Candidatus Marsarchaeota archaeon]
MDMYAEEIISHYEHPHNKGKIENASASIHEHNMVCGDDITVYVKIKGNKVDDIKFDGSGCAISTASASMLTDFAKGKSISELEKMGVSDMIGLIGVDPGPARLHCATISLKALKEALFMYAHKEPDAKTRSL